MNFEYFSLELEMRTIIAVFFSVLLDPLPGVEECGNSPEQDFTFRIAGKYLNFSLHAYQHALLVMTNKNLLVLDKTSGNFCRWIPERSWQASVAS